MKTAPPARAPNAATGVLPMDRPAAPSPRTSQKVLKSIELLCLVAIAVGLAWAIVRPDGGGATSAFCGFVGFLCTTRIRARRGD